MSYRDWRDSRIAQLEAALRRYVDARVAWLKSDERNEDEAGAEIDAAHDAAIAVLGPEKPAVKPAPTPAPGGGRVSLG